MKKFRSMHALKERISYLIDADELNQALQSVHDLVERIFTEPLCTSQVAGSKVLDELCQRIGKENLVALGKTSLITGSHPTQPVYVYVVTKLQKSGGHSRVIEDFISARPDARHLIFSTELSGKSDVNYLAHDGVRLEVAPRGNFRQRLTWLQEQLITARPERVYLFNHHQDSVAVAAIQPEMNLDASFYHHGDHHLCLGVYLSHLEHIDPHPMGYHHCRQELGIDNKFIPLTIEDKGARPSDFAFMQAGTLTTCTAARSNKIEVPYFTSYLDLIPELLKTTGGQHIHIGRLTPWALFKIRRGLKRQGVPLARFTYIPCVPSVWKALVDFRVDLYVASFPYGGGLTLIEAMGAGVPVALHRHIFSRTLSSIDLAYDEAFSWRAPAELLDYCASLTRSALEKAGRASRKQYDNFYSADGLRAILNDATRTCPTPDRLSDKFSVDSDEWVYWMERQLTLKRIFSRTVYRMFRRLRAWR